MARQLQDRDVQTFQLKEAITSVRKNSVIASAQPLLRGKFIMTYAIVTRPTPKKTIARNRMTVEQELALVCLVRERSELLKRKKDGFTLEEEWIRIKGDRAFSRLVEEFKFLILSLISRFNFLDQVTTDEMYQVAVIAVNQAIKRHNPNRNGKLSRFSSWAFLIVRSRFIDMSKAELGLHERTNKVRITLARNSHFANERTPLKVSMEGDLREKLNEIMATSLSDENSYLMKAFYYEGKRTRQIAMEIGVTECSAANRKNESRKKLRENPRLQELAQDYLKH